MHIITPLAAKTTDRFCVHNTTATASLHRSSLPAPTAATTTRNRSIGHSGFVRHAPMPPPPVCAEHFRFSLSRHSRSKRGFKGFRAFDLLRMCQVTRKQTVPSPVLDSRAGRRFGVMMIDAFQPVEAPPIAESKRSSSRFV